MILLGIDTSTRRVGVALGSEAGLLASIELGGPAAVGSPRHAEQLAPAIEFMCNQAGITLDRLTAVAVGIGPGMFTGLRVGVTTAKALGLALDIPLVPIASLDLIAYPLRHADTTLIVPTIDARRHEIYYALYRPVPGGVQRVSDYLLGTPDDLAAELSARGEDAVLCGDGALRFKRDFEDHDLCDLAGPGHSTPDLTALIELACARVGREQFEPARVVRPMYLRKSDAELAADARS
jgi:tRNA threonylcarbamoyladenosine biosynthesis protein TsaB